MLEILCGLGSWKGIQTASGGQDLPDPSSQGKGEAGADKWALPLALTHPHVDPVLCPWTEWSFPSFSTLFYSLSSPSSHLCLSLHCTDPFPLSLPLTLLSHQSFSSDLGEYEYFLHFLLCTDYASSPSKKKHQQTKTGVRCCPTTQKLTKSKPTSMEHMAGTSSTKHHVKEASSEEKQLGGSPCSLAD